MKKNAIRTFAVTAISVCPLLGLCASDLSGSKGIESMNWDWTVNEKWQVYYSTKNAPPPSIASDVTINPFFEPGHDFNRTPRDMYPEDGWMLVYRDLGTQGEAGPIPSFALYNRFNGKLRIAMYNASEDPSTYFKVAFSWENGDAYNGASYAT